jgi:hypothetical protein
MTRPKVPDDKRQRTAQACDTCKRRKQKVRSNSGYFVLAAMFSFRHSSAPPFALLSHSHCGYFFLHLCHRMCPAAHTPSFLTILLGASYLSLSSPSATGSASAFEAQLPTLPSFHCTMLLPNWIYPPRGRRYIKPCEMISVQCARGI